MDLYEYKNLNPMKSLKLFVFINLIAQLLSVSSMSVFGQKNCSSNNSLLGIYLIGEEKSNEADRKITWYISICRDNHISLRTSKRTTSNLKEASEVSAPKGIKYEAFVYALRDEYKYYIGQYKILNDTLKANLNDNQNISFLIIDSLNLKLIDCDPGFPHFKNEYAHKYFGFYTNHWLCGKFGDNNESWAYSGDSRDTLLENRKEYFWMYADSTIGKWIESIDAYRIYDTTARPRYKQ